MKYVVILCDGMADYPVPALGGKTPMMTAKKFGMDTLAAKSEVGLVKTIADGLTPGSDVANLSVMGYDPLKYYTGRSPLEAVSMGVNLADDDVAFRCNLVTLSDDEPYESKKMVDYCAGDISSQEAAEIIKSIQEHFGNGMFEFHSGISYRHCLVWHGGKLELGNLTPPHDIPGRVIKDYLSDHNDAKPLIGMMRESYNFLKDHPVNKARVAAGKRPANSIWLWGQGKKPAIPPFKELYGINASVISAVDLIKGIGLCAKMSVREVKGATGYIDTNFTGKMRAGLSELDRGQDLVYIHIEAPDECGHRNEPENKVRAIELIDQKIIMPIMIGLKIYDDYKIMVLPDHPTPIVTRTHAPDPVPYLIYHKNKEIASGVRTINEETAKQTGNFIEYGPGLMKHFLED